MLNGSLLRVAVLCSHRAPGLLHLLTRAQGRGQRWDVVCCLTSEDTFVEQSAAERHGIPIILHPVRLFYQQRGAQCGER